MSPLPLRAGRLAAVLAAALACAPIASAAPTVDDLRAEKAALADRDARLAARAAESQTALAEGRARLDVARVRYLRALDGLERRLRGIYVTDEPSPIIEFITGGDLDESQARLDLLEALGRKDRGLVTTYRDASTELHAAEEAARRRKDRAVAQRGRLQVERRVVDRRLAAAEKAQRERDRAQAAATTADPTALPVLGQPISAPSAGSSTDSATADASSAGDNGGRGLAAALVDGRGLPGDAPVDAASGTPIDAEPAPTGPDATRALPGVGVVGPAASSAQRTPDRLPTFTAVAQWYGPGFTSPHLASGEPYDPAAYSAASRTLRLGTMLRVAYGGKAVTVRVNDRGPYVRGRDLNLSQAAAAALALPGIGTVTVQILPGYGASSSRTRA